jgi:5-bromo-4-chloroindolyl phosphate hydrolysis protein
MAAVLVGSMMSEEIGLTPKQIAVLRAQLNTANERLLAIERQREQMQTYIATLADQLKRAESGRDGQVQ